MSDKDLIIELLGIAEVAEDGTVDFTDRAKEIIEELAKKYRKTPIYKQAKKETPEWVSTATAHMLIAPKILLPILWEKIQEEKEKQTAAGQEIDTETAEGGLQSAT